MAFTQEEIINIYKKRAKNFDITSKFYKLIGFNDEKYRKKTVEYLELSENDTIIEIGCGTGLNFPMLLNKIGKDGFEFIFKMSVQMHGDAAEEPQVVIDSTVQESNMTFPTDGKLAIKIIVKLLKIAKNENIKLRRSFKKEIKDLRIQLRFFKHPKKLKKLLVL